MEKLEISGKDRSPPIPLRSSTRTAVSAVVVSLPGDGLISAFARMSSTASRRIACSSVGTAAPLKRSPNQDPASTPERPHRLLSEIGPAESVVRSRVWSCSNTGTSSAVL